MKNFIVAMSVLFGISSHASDSSALPPGGGGGGGGGSCFTCSCSVTPTIGNKTCWCPSASSGGSGCQITYTPGWGNDCSVLFGPCLPPIGGFAP